MRIPFSLLFALFFLQSAYSQTQIRGKVVDENGEPLVAVVVQSVESNSPVAITDVKGEYALTVTTSDKKLKFSSLGYIEAVETIGGRTEINVIMKPDNYMLDELVVTGYSFTPRSDLTGSVGTVKADQIVERAATTLSEAMQGRVAGVQIISTDGAPGAEMTMKIRGTTSINGSSAPLYVVDGFIGEDITHLNPNDIASIDILMDASATAIYGSRGANGVVLISTKQGVANQKAQISYKGSYGVQVIPEKIPVLNTEQYVRLQNELGNMLTFWDNDPDLTTTDFQDAIYRIGKTMEHQIDVSGGDKTSRFYGSLSYLQNDGIVIESMYRRYGGRFNYTRNIRPNIKLITNNSVSNVRRQGLFIAQDVANPGVVTKALIMRPDKKVYSEILDTGEIEYSDAVDNPVLMAKEVTDVREFWYLNSNNALEIQLAKPLIWRSTLGVGYTGGNTQMYYPRTVSQGQSSNGKAINSYTRNLNILNENTLTFKKNWQKHKLDALVGATFQRTESNWWQYQSTQFPFDDLGPNGISLSGEQSPPQYNKYVFGLVSFLGRVNYIYADKYLLTASLRADGSSRFTDGNKWGYFPSAAFAYRISEEKFMKDLNLKFLSYLKFRVSWGVTGSQQIPNFASQNIYSTGLGYVFDGDNYTPTVSPSSSRIGNPDLTWETTTQTNVGVDIGLFSRVNLTINWYDKRTTDMLFKTVLPPSSGVSEIIRNFGSIRNRGLELTLNAVPVSRNNFVWELDANIAFNRNKVLSLGGNKYVYVDPTWKSSVLNEAVLIEGQPVGLWYGYNVEGVYQYNDPRLYSCTEIPAVALSPERTPGPGDYIYTDIRKDGKIDNFDKIVIGKAEPDFIGGFTSSFSWKTLTLTTMFSFSYGNDVFNANRATTELMAYQHNQSRAVLNRWQAPDLDNAGNPIPGTGNPSTTMAAAGRVPLNDIISPWIEDGSYLRLQNLILSWSLPKRWISKLGLSKLDLTFNAQNLWIWTKYSGYDPDVNTGQGSTGEIAPGLDYGSYPKSRSFTFGLNITL